MLDAVDVQTEEQAAPPSKTAERKRGVREARLRIPLLQKRWPALFRDDPRPLASACVKEVAAEMGWSVEFTRPVVMRWKLSVPYCKAVLKHTERVHLDGSASGETVDDKARAMAQANLDQKPAGARPRSASKPAPAPQPAPSAAEPAAPSPSPVIAIVQPERAPEPAKPTPAETRRAAQLKLMELAKRRKRR